MFDLNPEFDEFLTLWRNLPRRAHLCLPCKSDITPAVFGNLLHYVALAERRGAQSLYVVYAGDGYERNAGFPVMGRDYYDILPENFIKPMTQFHNNLLGTPCGAYIADVIGTTEGSQYIHYNVQFPATDEKGEVRYLIGYGLDRKPYTDKGTRTYTSHAPSNIKDMVYLDLGAGAPSAYVKDFTFHRADQLSGIR
ncbi:PAS domain-containing protein [Kordiimonas aestuarii]|uniref:hypothetical protein n=1 Tax=Kordiimonas aestuarii TaxID=1005925 RepID=UPI0021D2B600|nr:hypothetical protein [Kordiimonas aestuarii]